MTVIVQPAAFGGVKTAIMPFLKTKNHPKNQSKSTKQIINKTT